MNHTTHPSNTRKLVAPADRLCGITCGKELTVQSEKTEIRVEKAGGGTEPLNGIRTTEATTDQLIELAGALEQRRGLAIVDAVAPDGVIEGIELPESAHPYCLGVQWHPEFHLSAGDRAIFDAMIAACA